jgi:hypothetical protein
MSYNQPYTFIKVENYLPRVYDKKENCVTDKFLAN